MSNERTSERTATLSWWKTRRGNGRNSSCHCYIDHGVKQKVQRKKRTYRHFIVRGANSGGLILQVPCGSSIGRSAVSPVHRQRLPVIFHAQHDVTVGSDRSLTIPRLDVPVAQELGPAGGNDFPPGWVKSKRQLHQFS